MTEPSNRLYDTRYWHCRAEEQRAVGETTKDAKCRETMARLAQSSEQIARDLQHNGSMPLDNPIERILTDIYNVGCYHIIRQVDIFPTDVDAIGRWSTVDLLAKLCGRSAREVAPDLHERYEAMK